MSKAAKAGKGQKAKAMAAEAAKETAKAVARPLGKRAQIEADAAAGKLPKAPDFSAETHKRFRPALDEVRALIADKDVAGLKALEIKPISSSPKALARFRDLAVIALEARAGAAIRRPGDAAADLAADGVPFERALVMANVD
jgi:hypothetical protein